MMKKFFILFLTFIFFGMNYFCCADQDVYVGTPPGFYDDIDPDSLDKEDDIPALKQMNNNNNNLIDDKDAYQTYYENNDYSAGYSEQPKATKNYSDIYNNLEPADFSYQHNIDPDQYYDMKDTTWSVYPLLRLNSAIYFKNITIEPGYYLLTPREHKGKWYILFKQNGKVVHIIPVYDRDYTPETFYDEHIPKPKLTKSQKVHMKFLEVVGKFDSSKRREPVKTFLEVNDLENYFVSMIVYYGGHKYSMIFRTIRL